MRFHSLNGSIVSGEDASIPLADIGFRRGFAAFDFLRVVGGKPLFLEDHLDRFWHSSLLMGLEPPMERAALGRHLHALIERNGLGEMGLQLFLTGGVSADGFGLGEPNLAVYVTDVSRIPPELYQTGATLITHPHRREFHDAKTTNYQMALRLAPQMRAAGALDVLYHADGLALETTRSNLFVVDAEGRIATPGEGMLKGVTRANVLRMLADHGDVTERDVPLMELWDASEVFITSTTKGAMPITTIDDRTIGAGVPGPVTAEVRAMFEYYVDSYLER